MKRIKSLLTNQAELHPQCLHIKPDFSKKLYSLLKATSARPFFRAASTRPLFGAASGDLFGAASVKTLFRAASARPLLGPART